MIPFNPSDRKKPMSESRACRKYKSLTKKSAIGLPTRHSKSASNRNFENMATQYDPQEQITRLLSVPGVRDETKAIFGALLEACENKDRLSEFILESVNAKLDAWASQQGPESRVKIESIDDEGRRWLTDFLLIAIGKRNSGRNGRLASLAMLSHQAEANTYSDHNELLQDQPVPSSSSFEEPPVARESSAGRAIPRPNTSRSGDSQFVRLFPKSGDHERISRFRVLVNVFCRGFEDSLSDSNLDSPRNGLFVCDTLKDTLEEGGAYFISKGEQVYAVLTKQEPTVTLSSSARWILRVQQHGLDASRDMTVDKNLLHLHGIIVKTWVATGLSFRFMSDKRWIESLPLKAQNVSVLGVDLFSAVLQHRLAIV